MRARSIEGDLRGAHGPLAATLKRVGSGEGEMDLSARVGVPDGPGWVPAADLVADTRALDRLMGRLARTYGAENRAFVGTTLFRGVLWRILVPAVAAFLRERRLPDLRAENVALRFGEDGFVVDLAFVGPRFLALPDDPEAWHPEAVMVPEEDVLDVGIRVPVAETYLPALIPALKSLRVRRGRRTLERSAADVCAEAFIYVGRDLGREEEGVERAARLLAGPPPLEAPLDYRVLEFPGGSEARRVRCTCCLYYKTGNGTYFTCPRKTDEERVRQILKEEGFRGGEEA